MITLNSPQIWQWDTGHTVTVDGADSVHFAMPGDTQALVVEPAQASGVYTANVPNILLQRFGTLTCWRVIDGKVEQFAKYEVNPRPKPSDYVYEETTVDDYQQIKEWFTDSVEELEADYTAAIAEVEAATDSATDAAANANAAANAAQSAIDAMTGNVLRGTVGPSEVVSVDDAYPQVPLGVKVKGLTRQNLWVNPVINGTYQGITATESDDGSLSISGTAKADTYIVTSDVYTLKPSTTYTVSVDGSIATWGFYVETKGGSGKTSYYFGGNHSYTGLERTFTTPADLESVVFAIGIESGADASGTYRVMLNEGSEAEPWCPPGLNSVEGLEIWSAGKNLVEAIDDFLYPADSRYFAKVCLVGGKTYTLSFQENGNSVAYLHDEDGAFTTGIGLTLKSDGAPTGRKCASFAAPYTGLFYMSCSITEEQSRGVQIELGPAATDYEPPSVSSTEINLSSNALRSLPDGTCDELDIVTGALTKRVGEVITSGNDANITKSSASPYSNRYILQDVIPNDSLSQSNFYEYSMSDKLIGGGIWTSLDNNQMYTNNRQIWVGSDLDDVESFKDFFNGLAPMEVLYKLATPKTIQLAPPELPALPAPIANVWAVATDGHGNTFTLQPEIELEYARDVTLVIGSLEAKVAALELLHETE